MISYGSVSRSTFPSVVTAPTAELSVEAAMGGFSPAPVVLDGTLRSGLTIAAHNEARLEGWVRAAEKRAEAEALALAEAEAELAALEAEEGLTYEVDTDEIVEYTDADLPEGVLAEVKGFVLEDGVVYARLLTEDGELFDVAEELWAETTGDVTLDATFGRYYLQALRSENGLVAA